MFKSIDVFLQEGPTLGGATMVPDNEIEMRTFLYICCFYMLHVHSFIFILMIENNVELNMNRYGRAHTYIILYYIEPQRTINSK
jgi:hypothetical protein